jgi:hypothetical protein
MALNYNYIKMELLTLLSVAKHSIMPLILLLKIFKKNISHFKVGLDLIGDLMDSFKYKLAILVLSAKMP